MVISSPTLLPTILRYGIAVLSVAIATGLEFFLNQFGVRLTPFLFAVGATVWYAGTGPGVLAIVLSVLSLDYFFVPPFYSFSFGGTHIVYLSLCTLFALVIGWFSAARRRTEQELRQARDELDAKVAERTAELRESEERWKAVFENNPTMYFMVDATGAVISVNPFGAEQLGYTVDELRGASVLNVLHEADRAAAQRNMTRCLERLGQAMTWQVRKVRKDGSMLWIRESARAILIKGRPVVLIACEDINDRKHAEEAARRSEKELRDVVETIPAMVWSALPDGSVDFINRRWQEFTGLSLEGSLGWNWVTAIHPEDVEPYVAKWHASAATGQPFEAEVRIRGAADGEYRWFLESAVPLRDDEGSILKWYGFVVDIEDRKRAEEAARRSEKELRDVVETIPAMVWSALPDGSVDFINRRWQEFTGLSLEALSGWNWEAAVHPEDLEHDVAKWRASVATGQPFEAEARRRSADGEYRWFSDRAVPVRDEQGTILKWYGLMVDIEARKRAEYLTGQVFESSPDAMCVVGRDYRFQRVNPVYERVWGMPPERIVGKHVGDLLGTTFFEQRLKPNYDRCFAGKEVRYAEWFSYPFGRCYLLVTYSPLRPHSERVEAALVVTRDLTDHMLASEALRATQGELAHVNRVTTVGQLTASIAHEVSQPIAGVVTNAEAAFRWLGARPPNLDEIREALGRILKDGKRAGNVIGRIRGLVKKAPPLKDRFDLNEAVLDVITLTRSEVLQHGVSLETQLATDLAPVEGDRVQLQQVILNLILNAVEAMGGIDGGRAGAADQHRERGLRWRARHRSGFRPGARPAERGPPVRGLLHDQARGHGRRPGHLPVDHQGARGTAVGHRE